MPGGTFNINKGKIRPGTYINVESARIRNTDIGTGGIVLLPLLDLDYGESNKFVLIDGEDPNASKTLLGYSVADEKIKLIGEALKEAKSVLCWIPKQGAKAKHSGEGITAEAKYGGARGNALSYSVKSVPESGFDVTIYLDSDIVETHREIANMAALCDVDSKWITFTGEGTLAETAGASLTGGVTPELTNADIAEFLDASETEIWDTLAFPYEADTDKSLLNAVVSKIKYLRDDCGKYRRAVVANFEANYEAVVNITNGVITNEGETLTPADLTAWAAGLDVAAGIARSNTWTVYKGASAVYKPKTNAQAEQAILNGEFFFTLSDDAEVIVEKDINSLTDFAPPKNESYQHNRVIRTIDSFCDEIKKRFKPNTYDNNEEGWDLLEGTGKALLLEFAEAGAIGDVDMDEDFLVDRVKSKNESVYVDVRIKPYDSVEKLYFSIRTL